MNRYIVRTTHNLSYAGELCVKNEKLCLLKVNATSGLMALLPSCEIKEIVEVSTNPYTHNSDSDVITSPCFRDLFCSVVLNDRTVFLGEMIGTADYDSKKYLLLKPSIKSDIKMLLDVEWIDFVLSMSGQKLDVDRLVLGKGGE